MKKHYIIPTTASFAFRTDYLCQAAVNSVQGGIFDMGPIDDAGEGI